jgi:alkaline phosphatase
MTTSKKILSALFFGFIIISLITAQLLGVNTQSFADNSNSISTSYKTPKYIFMFIGDGMSHVQVNAAQVYTGNNESGKVALGELEFTQFPVAGMATTQDSTSFCPDSASTATSFASGVKTHSGVIGKKVDKTQDAKNITEIFKENGKKIGIISTVTINHATPAAYYAHAESRNQYYDIALQMATSNIDYFAGGAINKPTGDKKDQKDAYEILAENEYTITKTKEDFAKLDKNSGKIYAQSPKLQDSGSMPYSIDYKSGDLKLSDFVRKGIEVLDNENGFFMMTESGKIDWACHANDAMSTIADTLELNEAVKVAKEFADKHPDETLIIVTGDHETGGLTIGQAYTGYDTAFNLLRNQKMSYVAFDDMIAEMKSNGQIKSLDDVMPIINQNFGLKAPSDGSSDSLAMTDYEYKKLQAGFEESMKEEEARTDNQEASIMYGGYDPLSVSLTHILNNKAGIGWTSYSHTGTPVPVFAYGAGAELFNGSYDNTDVFFKTLKAVGIR